MASLTTGETKTKPEIISTQDQEEQQDECPQGGRGRTIDRCRRWW